MEYYGDEKQGGVNGHYYHVFNTVCILIFKFTFSSCASSLFFLSSHCTTNSQMGLLFNAMKDYLVLYLYLYIN